MTTQEGLAGLGFSPFFAAQQALLEGAVDARWVPARVSADSGGLVELLGCRRTLGELTGKLEASLTRTSRPTTGDWVLVDDEPDHAVIHHVLDRRTALVRRAAGGEGRAQVVAANVDVFFIVTAADRDLNLRRIERYLTAVFDSGATPVVVLNKADLAEDLAALTDLLGSVAIGVDVVAVSAATGDGLDALQRYLGPGITIGFVGSSGVGKSSLINRWLEGDERATLPLGALGKGRHTTTRRELVVLPGGGLLIDTPGMRELGLVGDDEGLDAAFPDIAALAAHCRFRDCAHEGEPGCAVEEALASGALSEERAASYRKLRKELAAAERRSDPQLAANAKRRWKAIHKGQREFQRSHDKRRER